MSEGTPPYPGQQPPPRPVPGQQPPAQPHPGQQPPPQQPYPGQAPPPQPAQPHPSQQQPGYAAPGPPPAQPGGFPPSSSFPPPSPVEKKKSRWWLWLLLGLGAMVLLIGGCVAVFYNAVRGPIDTSNEFLALIDERNFEAAFELVDPSCAEGGPESLATFFGDADITDYDLDNTSVNNSNGRTTGVASGTITYEGNETLPIEFGLNNNDGWEICSINVGN